jgi:hypothetical protein
MQNLKLNSGLLLFVDLGKLDDDGYFEEWEEGTVSEEEEMELLIMVKDSIDSYGLTPINTWFITEKVCWKLHEYTFGKGLLTLSLVE